MSIQLDLAKAHKERLARMWPEKAKPNWASIKGLQGKIDDLERQLEELKDELTARLDGQQSLAELRQAICLAHDITVDELMSVSRKPRYVRARREFARKARPRGVSLKRIGSYIGRKDHTSILHYLAAEVG